MRYSLLFTFVLIMFGLVGCESSEGNNALTINSEQVKNEPLTESIQKSNDKLIIQKRVGMENRYEDHKEINEEKSVSTVKSILQEGEWEKVKFEMSRSADYKVHFQPTDGSEAKAVLYEIWFTNDIAEIYISGTHSYKKTTKEDAEALGTIIK
ncbi:hypothetical protein [Bacillus sp. FJAT-28004]|uniref:hypothetical protein n=1 Tax=Bacillus sp. FJAT-28004 TaxID=1679165 RepID=UPI0006B56DA1|nr:hypothetical protein [Bacillus sp. FJAT-28004]